MKRLRLPVAWRGVFRGYLVPTIMGLVIASGIIWYLSLQTTAIDGLRANYGTLQQQYESLYSEAIVEGVNPSAPPPEDVPPAEEGIPPLVVPQPGPSGATGATGATGKTGPGPTNQQVLQALGQYCSQEDCRPIPTISQVAAALSDYCSTNNCQGEQGTKGEKGADSTVPGPEGPTGRPPTAEEIATAVGNYCSTRNSCRGDTGPAGRPPTAAEIQEQVGIYCDANNGCQGPRGIEGEQGEPGTAKPGTYTCPEGEFITSFSVSDDGTVTLSCESSTPPVIDPLPEG